MQPTVTLAKGKLLLLHNVADVNSVLNHVSPSKLVRHPQTGAELIAAKHTLLVVRQLQQLGINAPSPVLLDYNWPGRFSPFAHQRETVEFLTRYAYCLLLSDMGTGKTASVLWAADYLMNIGMVRKVLVTAPLSCLNRVWADEAFQILPHRSVEILHAARDRRKYLARRSKADFLVVNHDGIEVIKQELIGRKDIDLIVLDEAAAYRNARTDRYRTTRGVIKATNANLWLMTGTPTPNAPTDAWALARLVNPQGTTPSFTKFRDSTMWKATQFKWRPRDSAKAVVRGVLQPAIRHKKEDCVDLPPVTYVNREAAMSPAQLKAFEQMRIHLIAEAAGEPVSALNAATKMIKLLQICCGSVYADDGSVAQLPIPDRMRVLLELIEQANGKVIVYVPFRHSIRRVAEELTKNKISNRVIHGGVTQKERDSIIQKFQLAIDPAVLVAQPRTASHGLNLTVADVTVWFGPIFSAEQYQQANERMARPGQDKHMTIAHLGAHKLEWGAYGTVKEKGKRQASILSLYENVLGHN